MAGNFWRSSHYLEWILDKQFVLKNREFDLKELGGEDEYQKLMIFFTGVIFSFGEKLGVRQQVIAAAVTYFKRFYALYSLKSVDPWLLAQTSLFLSSKIEEFGLISQKSIVQTCNAVIKQKYSQYFPRECSYKIQDILDCEFILVEILGCSLIIFHPYRSLLVYCENLNSSLSVNDSSILQLAWKVVNDSLMTDLLLYYPPHLISLGCLCFTCAMTRRGEEAQNWFSELSIDFEKLMEVVNTLTGLYNLWRVFDEETETIGLLSKMPKPRVQPNQVHSNNNNNNQQQQQHSSLHQQVIQQQSGTVSSGINNNNKSNSINHARNK